MKDGCVLMRAMLLADSTFFAALGSGKVFVGVLPAGHDTKTANYVTIEAQGGNPHPEILDRLDQHVQIRVWGKVDGHSEVRALYLALRTMAHGAQQKRIGSDGIISCCLEVVSGQDVTDPDTGWATMVAFYNVISST